MRVFPRYSLAKASSATAIPDLPKPLRMLTTKASRCFSAVYSSKVLATLAFPWCLMLVQHRPIAEVAPVAVASHAAGVWASPTVVVPVTAVAAGPEHAPKK